MKRLEVCLVRHAESVANASGRWQGHGNSPLSERGRTQAQALGGALADESYDLVLSSDLSRAADTAASVDGGVEPDRAWREIDVGAWEGLTMEEVTKRFPDQVAALQERREFAVGGGESWPMVFARVDEALAALRKRMNAGGRVLVVTHGGVIAAVLAGLVGARERKPWPLGRIRNTARTTLRFSEAGVELLAHNDDSHVPDGHRHTYIPRQDQSLVRFICTERAREPGNSAELDFNSAIKVARSERTGEVMSVFGSGSEIAGIGQETANPSAKDFRFVAPREGSETDVLVSKRHTLLVHYGIGSLQI